VHPIDPDRSADPIHRRFAVIATARGSIQIPPGRLPSDPRIARLPATHADAGVREGAAEADFALL
jgi:hypothetical protein